MKADRLRDELHSWTYFLYTLCNVILAYVLQMQFEHEETNLKTWEAWHLFKEIGVVDVYNKCLNELFVYFFSSYFYGNKLCMVLDKILLWKFDYNKIQEEFLSGYSNRFWTRPSFQMRNWIRIRTLLIIRIRIRLKYPSPEPQHKEQGIATAWPNGKSFGKFLVKTYQCKFFELWYLYQMVTQN